MKEIDFTTDYVRNVCKFLRMNGANFSEQFIRDEIITHPDYPSLLSLTDFLEINKLKYEAITTTEEYLHQLNYPILAHSKAEFGIEGTTIVPDKNSWTNILKNWSGIVIMPEKNSNWVVKKKDTFNLHNSTGTLYFGILICLTLTALLILPTYLHKLFLLFSTIGVVIAWLTYSTEIGIQNKLSKQICGMGGANGCNAILKSKPSRGILGITPADAGLAWFLAQWIALILGTFIPQFAFLSSTTIAFSIVGIGAVAWSLFVQKFIEHKWCALCLGLVLVLCTQAIISIFDFETPNIKGVFYILFLIAFFLVGIIIPLRQLLNNTEQLPQIVRKLKRWQTDAQVFMNLLKQQPFADCNPILGELEMGVSNAPVQITVACNPYCTPCAKAHKTLEKIVARFPKHISIKIRFSIDAYKTEDARTRAAQLIALAARQNKAPVDKLLNDWFDLMDEEKWKEIYQPDTTKPIGEVLQQFEAWSKDANITFTPTIFINGYRLPGQYTVNELEPIIPELIEYLSKCE